MRGLTHATKVPGCAIDQLLTRSISTRSIDHVLQGRSPGPVGVLAIASTTFADCSSATWPKMVCRWFRCGVGPTVMKNCEPLVPGPGVRHRQQVGPVEAQLRVELVAELVARAATAGAGRVAHLDHETGDHPVRDGAVVVRPAALLRRSGGRCTPWCPRPAPRSCARSSARGSGTAPDGSGRGSSAGWRRRSLPRVLLSLSRLPARTLGVGTGEFFYIRILPCACSGTAGVPEKAT